MFDLWKEIQLLQEEAKKHGAEVLSKSDKYMQDWYAVQIGDDKYELGTNEHALKAFLKGFLAGVNK